MKFTVYDRGQSLKLIGTYDNYKQARFAFNRQERDGNWVVDIKEPMNIILDEKRISNKRLVFSQTLEEKIKVLEGLKKSPNVFLDTMTNVPFDDRELEILKTIL